ncbi:MAG: helix-turn-helix domain-containing protein [Planctomycetota bacterium]|nr:helix-turn-helix domain-containing protein [Planctomycetota bacterium]
MLSASDLDRFLGWGYGTARRLARQGKIPHYKLDGEFFFGPQHLVAILSSEYRPPHNEEGKGRAEEAADA